MARLSNLVDNSIHQRVDLGSNLVSEPEKSYFMEVLDEGSARLRVRLGDCRQEKVREMTSGLK